eukprot:scaffold1567_cov129-Skeletonema_menzelii.AAC.6
MTVKTPHFHRNDAASTPHTPPITPMQQLSLYTPCSSGWSFFWFPSIAFQKKGNEIEAAAAAEGGRRLAGHTISENAT